MTEPAVALTDFALGIECILFTTLLARGAGGPLRPWLILFFASIAAASIIGGTTHGFFHDPGSRGQAILWPGTLLAIGITSLSAWVIGAKLALRSRVARWVTIAATLQFLIYAAAVLLFTEEFWLAVLNYLPASVFLLVSLVIHDRRGGDRQTRIAILGLLLTWVAALIQQGGIGIDPLYFDHNALYHLFQALALLLIFLGARSLARRREPSWRPEC